MKKIIYTATILLLTEVASYSNEKPNIVFIMADDLGYQDVGFNGSKWFETPHLDALAKESVVFQNTSMYPTCSPSRTAIFTGKHSFRTQVYTVPVLEKGKPNDNIYSRWTVEKKHKFYSQPLNEAGYQLIHLGKYHVVGPYPEKETSYPFDKKLSQPANGDLSWVEAHKEEYKDYYPLGKGFHKNVGGTFWGDPARGYDKGYKAEGGGYRTPYKNPFIEEPKDDIWLTDHLTNEAIKFMDDNKDKPFFINLNYYTPHRPTVATSPEALNKYQAKAKDTTTGQHGKFKKEIAGYATMVENMDENVGRLIKYLDDSGQRKNTIIIFTSDNGHNGLQSGTTQLRGSKGEIYEGGIRVPALLSWKGKVQPSIKKENITVLDFFPTFLDAAGIENYDDDLDGDSFLDIAQNEKNEERTLFWYLGSQYIHGTCVMIKQGPMKYIYFLKTGKEELYNLERDPAEKQNIAKTDIETAKGFNEKMRAWLKGNEVPLPKSLL